MKLSKIKLTLLSILLIGLSIILINMDLTRTWYFLAGYMVCFAILCIADIIKEENEE